MEIARGLAERGFRVWLSGRNEEAGRKAAEVFVARNLDVRFVLLDVSLLLSIQRAFDTLAAETEKLDVLVNNAGVKLDESGDILKASPHMINDTMNTNALGTLYVTQAAMPLLKSGSRVINISSGLGQLSKGISPHAPLYSISKATMNAITCQLAYALKPKGIAVNAVNPGWVKTKMGGGSAPRSVEQGADTPLWLATQAPIEQTGLFWHDKKIIPW